MVVGRFELIVPTKLREVRFSADARQTGRSIPASRTMSHADQNAHLQWGIDTMRFGNYSQSQIGRMQYMRAEIGWTLISPFHLRYVRAASIIYLRQWRSTLEDLPRGLWLWKASTRRLALETGFADLGLCPDCSQ